MKSWNLDRMLNQGCVTRGHVQVRFKSNYGYLTFLGFFLYFVIVNMCDNSFEGFNHENIGFLLNSGRHGNLCLVDSKSSCGQVSLLG